MAATQALKELLAEGIEADVVERIGVAVLPSHQKMIDHGVTAGDRFSHLTSVQYQMALAALTPDAAYALSAPAGPVSSAISAFMAKISVRAEEGLLGAGYPRAWAAHVTVTTRSRQYERTVTHVSGDPARPFGEDDLKAKFRRVIAVPLESEQAGGLYDRALVALDRPLEMLGEIERVSALGRV